MAETMSIARDWALILLAVESLVLALVPLFLYLKTVQGLSKLLPQVRPFLRRVRAGSRRVERSIEGASRAVAQPFVTTRSAHEAVRAFWQAIRARRG